MKNSLCARCKQEGMTGEALQQELSRLDRESEELQRGSASLMITRGTWQQSENSGRRSRSGNRFQQGEIERLQDQGRNRDCVEDF